MTAIGVVKRLFASHRRRKRLLWGASLAAFGTAAGLLVVFVNNTAPSERRREVFSNEPARLYKEPETVLLTKRELAVVHDTAVRFIETAVMRKNLDAAWEITDAGLRAGYTRAQWLKGDIPVVPYPAESPKFARWRLAYSYRGDVMLAFALLPRKGEKVRPMAWSIELKATGSGKNRHWLVSSWTPLTGPRPAPPSGSGRRLAPPPAPEGAALSAEWLIIPLALLAGILLVPLGLGVRGWWRRRRAERLYPPPPGENPFSS